MEIHPKKAYGNPRTYLLRSKGRYDMCHTTRDYTTRFLSYESNTVQLFNLFLCKSALKIKMTGTPIIA